MLRKGLVTNLSFEKSFPVAPSLISGTALKGLDQVVDLGTTTHGTDPALLGAHVSFLSLQYSFRLSSAVYFRDKLRIVCCTP